MNKRTMAGAIGLAAAAALAAGGMAWASADEEAPTSGIVEADDADDGDKDDAGDDNSEADDSEAPGAHDDDSDVGDDNSDKD